jgi:pimeloyl-ACP methyl ester carboxylesterase
MTPARPEKEAYAQHSVKLAKSLAGSGFPVDEERIRKLALQAFERNFSPMGFVRQYAAIITSGSRTDRLSRLPVSTLVIHGEDDPLVPVESGKNLAAVIPGSKLEIIKGMGHDLPVQTWPYIIRLITDLTEKSQVS